MYYIKNQQLLLFLVASLLASCCYAISITSPSSNSDIVAGSTVLVTWTAKSNTSFDIQLKKYIDSTTDKGFTTEVVQLASDIKSSTNSHSVTIPANLSATATFIIAITEKNTVLASTGPLQLVLSSKSKSASNSSEDTTASSSMGQSITSVSPSSAMSTAAQSITVPPSSDIMPIITFNNGNNSYLTNTDTSSSNDIGLTLSSGQMAGIALSIVGGASLIFGLFVFIKSMINRRKSPALGDEEEVDYDDDDDASSQQSTQLGGYSSSNNSSIRSATDKKRVNIMENINEEDIHYDSLYYGQHYTEDGGFHLTPSQRGRSPSPALRISTDNHPFGRPPLQFNSNTYHIDIPVPQSTYNSHHHHSESSSSHFIDIDFVRRTSSPTVPPILP